MLLTGSPVHLDGLQAHVKTLRRVISLELYLEWFPGVYNLIMKSFIVLTIFEYSGAKLYD